MGNTGLSEFLHGSVRVYEHVKICNIRFVLRVRGFWQVTAPGAARRVGLRIPEQLSMANIDFLARYFLPYTRTSKQMYHSGQRKQKHVSNNPNFAEAVP